MTSKTGSTILSALMFAGASLMFSPAVQAAAAAAAPVVTPPVTGLPDFSRPGRQGRPGGGQYPHHRARAPRPGRGRTRRCRNSCAASSAARCRRADVAAAAAPQQPQEEQVQRGVGSGFIISDDGYVMTNAHVVEGADEVTVTLTDRREFKAKVLGADKRSDVALLKVDARNLPSLRIGDSNRIRVGEWVIAIGSPFNLENTVTAGIISAKARDTGEYLPLIQSDVAVNPGNSGGPLINMRGEVIGINSQIATLSGAYNGISFAVPIDEVMRVSRPDQEDRQGHARAPGRADQRSHARRRRIAGPGPRARRRGRHGRAGRPGERAASRSATSS